LSPERKKVLIGYRKACRHYEASFSGKRRAANAKIEITIAKVRLFHPFADF
jgi:hypothetical protein